MDVTAYLDTYRMTAHELAMTMIRDVLKNTGITATAGIGTNLYLCKIAMDIMAKKAPADKDGVRIAELNEMSYREQLWDYTPITKFWRVGKGIAEKLAQYGMYTMGDVALCSVERERTALADSIHAMNARLMVSIWPNPQYCPEEKDFRKRGFMLEHSVYDVFNADACRHYWKYANDEFFSNGFDAWRCDSSEPLDGDWNKIPESLGEKPYGWNDHERRWHLNKDVLSEALGAERNSLYSLYHSMGLYENQRLTDSDKRVLNLTRSSYARQQRYATVVWNGDTHASCESYRQQIPAGLNYMATGNPYWTVDVGSFFVKNDYSLSLLAWDDSKQKLKLKIVKKSRIYNREIKVNVVKYILANHSWE